MNHNELKAGAILNYIIIFLNSLVGLLYTPYMLRSLGQSEYGLYSLVASVIAYLTILDLVMGNAIIRYTAKFRAEGKVQEQFEMFGMFFVLYVGIGVLAILVGLVFYFNLDSLFGRTMSNLEISRARIMMLILIFNLAITFPMSIFHSIMTAYERFVFPRIINIIRILLNTVVMIVLLKMGYKAVALVIVQTIFNIATLVVNYIYCKKQLRIKLVFGRFNLSFLKEVAIYSFWIFLNVIMDRIYWNTGQFVLGSVSGTIAVSIFAVAIQLQSMYMQFSSAISTVFLPRVTSMITKDSGDTAISDLFIKTGIIQFFIMAFILSGFIVFGSSFIVLWAGPEYKESYTIALLFFIALLIPLIQNLGITILQAKNQMKFRSIVYLIIAAIALLGEIILARRYGGIGCAYAIAGALLLGQGFVMNYYYRKVQKIDIRRFWKEISQMSVAPICIVLLSLLLFRGRTITSWKSLFFYISAFSVVYLSVVYMFSLNSEEKQLFSSPIKILKKRF